MAEFVKGNAAAAVLFPFSDLIQSKRHPALVVSTLERDDLILCQITSQTVKDNYAVSITDNDFKSGNLKQAGNIRPDIIFTADSHIIIYKVDSLTKSKVNIVIENII